MAVQKNILIGNTLTMDDVALVSDGCVEVLLSEEARKRVLRGSDYLKQVSQKEVVYGVNTGFGPMARTFINSSKQKELQYNLVRSHAVGQGATLELRSIRAMMVIRLNTLAKGYSGVNLEVLDGLINFINNDILPVVFEHGSVGASGDLVQLAHISLGLIGEGEVFVRGDRVKSSGAIKKLHLKKVELSGRDGLALINGTASMTAIAAVNLIEAKRLVCNATLLSALIFEIVSAGTECVDPIISNVRPHAGQKETSRLMRDFLKGSKMVKKTQRRLVPKNIIAETGNLDEMIQEIYSLRCVPQIIGPVLDTINSAINVVEIEMNSVTDNPIVDPDRGVFHAGNFHGDYVSLEMDKVKIAVTKLSLLMERQINFLFNPHLNGKLPPFVNTGTLGLNLGLQGLQFVATSNAAENQTLSTPMSVHSISTNNDNQDIVSMGTNSAILASRVIENTFQIQSILCIAACRAVAYLKIEKNLGSGTSGLYVNMRDYVPFGSEDVQMYDKIAAVKEKLKKFVAK